MIAQLRRILHRKTVPVLCLCLAAPILLCLLPVSTARACWNNVLIECFDRPPLSWPWQNPSGSGRQWRVFPASPRWHPQDVYYDQSLCSQDQHSVWCFGFPVDNDPEYDQYSPNLDTYMTYGPINLSSAVAARVSFYLYNESEPLHDSVYWGAASTPTLTPDSMHVAGSFWGNMQSGFEPRTMDLSNLRNYVRRDSVSMLGRSAVYLFWRFKADGNAVRGRGAFVDNVQASWDDGGLDLIAGQMTIRRPNGEGFIQPLIGDTAWAWFSFSTCLGGIPEYPPFQVNIWYDTTVVLDTVISGSMAGSQYELGSSMWIFDTPGQHVIRAVLDTLAEVTEAIESNNAAYLSYFIQPPNDPPTFNWITPGTDTLWADSVAMLRWSAFDPQEQADLTFYTDTDNQGCVGLLLPGGMRTENDGPDSLAWNTTSAPDGRVAYPFVLIQDAENSLCVYAPFPVVVRHGTQSVRRESDAVPGQFFLEQNFPNPFNPVTEIRYGLTRRGAVSLRVYDLLGRAVAVLVQDVQIAGTYTVSFDATGLASGLYLCVLATPEGTLSRKLMLMK